MKNRTKIVATLGPASSAPEVMEKMIKAGVNVFRINFSHGLYDIALQQIKAIREINEKLKVHTAILADLQGPKLRIGLVENNGIDLIAGNEIIITTQESLGTSESVFITYPQFPKDVKQGENILIDDGKILLRVIETNHIDSVRATIIHGGVLSSKKGVNLPNTKVSLPCLTPKDLRDLDFALEQNIEWIGLSFVRSVTDIADLKDIIKSKGKQAKVIAKIEKPEALLEIDNIIDLSDAIMVARGDLGVELPMQEVPMVQKMLVKKCMATATPVIIATQMMESMITNFAPTRAEVNDVANAVLDGADAVMLSGETSVGMYPVKVIEAMSSIISNVEKHESIYYKEIQPSVKTQTFLADSICFNSCVLAKQATAKAIISMTNSGYTAFKIASQRPQSNIFIFTDNQQLLTTLSLLWGVQTFYYDRYESTDQTISDIIDILKNKNLLIQDDLVINIASMPMKERGRTNMMKLSQVK
jgi:pyruvate kinase